MQLFGYKFQSCSAMEGSQQLCPPGLDPLTDCPDHFDCYLPCEPGQVGCRHSRLPACKLDPRHCALGGG
jgi:hypothetical protein